MCVVNNISQLSKLLPALQVCAARPSPLLDPSSRLLLPSPDSLPQKCPSLFNPAIHSVLTVRLPSLHLLPPFPPRLTSLPQRPFDPERETFFKYHKPQCRSCIFQNQDNRPKGPLFYPTNHVPLLSTFLALLRAAQFRKGRPGPDG